MPNNTPETENPIGIPSIKKRINQFEGILANKTMKSRWNDDMDLYRLKAYDAGRGYYSFTTNAPRVLADKMQGLLNQANLIVRYPIETLTEEERTIASNCERFVYGSIDLNNQVFYNQNLPSLAEQMSWYSTIRGGFGLLVFVHKNEKGETIPEIRVWDLYSMAYEIGADGIVWAANTRKASRASVIDEYPELDLTPNGKAVTIIDYWDKKNHGIIANNMWAKPLEPHGLDYCPVYVIFVGAMPPILSDNIADINAERAPSVFAPNRGLYPILNKTLSDLLSIVRRGVKVPLLYTSADGTKTLDQDVWQTEKAATIPLASDEKLEPLEAQTMPKDAAALLEWLSGESQRGALPHTSFGELNFRLSGFAINQLQEAVITVISPYVMAETRGYIKISTALLKQYTKGKFPSIAVRGRTSRDELFGVPEAYQIRPSALKGDWIPEIRLDPVLPKDDAQRVMMAEVLKRTGLLSDLTILDETLEVRDPDLEEQKKDSQFAKTLPLLRLYKTFRSHLAREEFEEARWTLLELQRALQQAQPQQQAQPTFKGKTPAEITAMGSPGTGMPPEQLPFPPSVMPTETLGGFPPGGLNAEGA